MGKLIAFDGVDRSGKTTTVNAILDIFSDQSIPIRLVTTDRLIGNRIPTLFNHYPDEIVYMLFWQAIRAAELTEIIPSLRKGEIVLVDRYVLTNLAYDWWSNLDNEFKKHMDEVYVDRCTQPDLLFLFTIPYEVFLERDDGDTKLSRAIFETIQQSYLFWSKQLESEKKCSVIVVDGSLDKETVFNIVYNNICKLLNGEPINETAYA